MKLGHAQIERLIHYYHLLISRASREGKRSFSSAEIAELVHVDGSQVRKDLAAIGVKGHPRVGFITSVVTGAIRGALGLDGIHRGVIVGSGRLGGALASYGGFAGYGLTLVGAFDVSPSRIGRRLGELVIQPIDELEDTVRRRRADLAIVTVPARAAQEVADRLVRAGVRAIWNFATTTLRVPSHVYVRNEHISVGLGDIAHHLHDAAAKKNASWRRAYPPRRPSFSR